MSLHDDHDVPAAAKVGSRDLFLFWSCFIALIATAFAFIIRALIMDEWQRDFGLTETEKGEIFGVGLWPFAISIVLFSLIIDKIGYGKAMAFAFATHLAAAVILFFAETLQTTLGIRGYWVLYIGSFIMALGNGTVEAVINPVVATLFPGARTKWLNILHAGWPGGLVLGGILTIAMSDEGVIGRAVGGAIGWQWKVALVFLPVIAYGVLMLPQRFPVSERVAAGVSYKAMLQQVGILGALIVSVMIVWEVTRVFQESGLLFQGMGDSGVLIARLAIVAVLTGAYGAYVQSLGRPVFIFLLLIMIPLATTELGTDSWITSLMEPEMTSRSLHPGWVLVYTSLIMLILRFFAGPIVHRISPLGLLAVSAVLAAIGLVFLSKATGVVILGAATVYGFGKTFFWPTMLGVVAEQYPRGGAMTLNTIAGVGMLSVGVLGNPLLGNIQDREAVEQLAEADPAVYEKVVGEERLSVFGTYRPLIQDRVDQLPPEQLATVTGIRDAAKKNALMTVAIFPCIMFVSYVILILFYRSQGGYKPQILVTDKEEEQMMTGGVAGPAEM
ncbi:MFS transporter [Tautonia plasticadhaerens]|uniref:Major Facilitator Superfamily protein n=1 Tax=Tautonia plasticadhaerens TaxID=2527974 RepID=A0A518GZ11_9BACT|nr:MFS transporter [Tautonia plasticadhaerens]QDV33762.1 Major Facilitator Superfamily protein [Tautonia plasticadhaerens]